MFAPETVAVRVKNVQRELLDLVGDFDPDSVFFHEADALFADVVLVERLAASLKTLLAGRVEAAASWRQRGYRSAADQLAGVSGTSVSAARDLLETSKQLEALPATAAALREGALSPAKAELIAAAATIAPGAEAALLTDVERKPLAELRNDCLRARAAVDRDGTHERIHRQRSLREYTDKEGVWHLHAKGTPEAGAAFRFAHGPLVDEMFKTARQEGRQEPYEAYAFDAFIALAERANTTDTTSTANDTTASATTKKKRAKRTPPKFLGLVRVDHAALQRGTVEGDELCEITGLGPIPVSTARDLLGDAILKLVITKGVDVAHVTHLGRSATVAQNVALWWQSPTCDVEGCTHTRRLQTDHVTGWAKTHETKLDDLDRLCKYHHDLKTYDNWALINGEGPRPMVPPDDPRHPQYRAPPKP